MRVQGRNKDDIYSKYLFCISGVGKVMCGVVGIEVLRTYICLG